MTAEEAPELQREVQRLLGRCMLRLQQCEAVIKAVVVHYEFSGPASNLAAILEAKSDSMKKVSLGAAVGKLVGTYLVPEGQELPSDDGGPDDVMWFGFRAQFAMDAAEFAQTELRLREFVDLRNTLVHHFIEQFDLWSVTGCVAARDHLRRHQGSGARRPVPFQFRAQAEETRRGSSGSARRRHSALPAISERADGQEQIRRRRITANAHRCHLPEGQP